MSPLFVSDLGRDRLGVASLRSLCRVSRTAPFFIGDLPTAARAIAGDSRYPSKGPPGFRLSWAWSVLFIGHLPIARKAVAVEPVHRLKDTRAP